MSRPVLNDDQLPGLFQSADTASVKAQSTYFLGLKLYLFLLVVAATVTFLWPSDAFGAIASAVLFLLTLGILIFLRLRRPDDTWYNGRAVAESVKTRAWRWAMCAEPYESSQSSEEVTKLFIDDLKNILNQNSSLCNSLEVATNHETVTEVMIKIRSLSVAERLAIYQSQRIDSQAAWYSAKSKSNKTRSSAWFWVSVVLHCAAIVMLLYRIKEPELSLPTESVAVAAGAVITWLQAKKHNELNSSYALAAHEIVLIKAESQHVKSEQELSAFVLDAEHAFSREHTQWVARKSE